MPEPSFDLPGMLRRIRRRADLSQRELARAAGLSPAAVAHAELGSRDLRVGQLLRAAACAGLRLVLLDQDGWEVAGMADDTVRDLVGRRFPAHLDPVLADERPSRFEGRSDRRPPVYTVDRDRAARDRDRAAGGTPEDHRRPHPDDDPSVRRARGRREALRRVAAERERPEFACGCPPGCDSAREVLAEVHVEACRCRCDIA